MDKRFLVDRNAPVQIGAILSGYGVVFHTLPLRGVTGATATHPDMQFLQTGKGTALVAAELAEYYEKLFPDLEITAVNGIREPYPYDSLLNVAELRKARIITSFQRNNLPSLPVKNEITVRQGYAKCSLCVLNDNAILTADKGIAEKALSAGLRAYCLPDSEIVLDGYKNGFWGGCSGLIDDGTLLFCGNIEKLSIYAELSEILKRETITAVYPADLSLTDFGSVLTVY